MAVCWGLAVACGSGARAQVESPGVKGAQVYCYMRGNGSSHEVSWKAAYSLIKRQSASLFKTSPTHAAVMITEALVQNPNSFPNCGRYLGDLYSAHVKTANDPTSTSDTPSTLSGPSSSQAGDGGMTRGERYGN